MSRRLYLINWKWKPIRKGNKKRKLDSSSYIYSKVCWFPPLLLGETYPRAENTSGTRFLEESFSFTRIFSGRVSFNNNASPLVFPFVLFAFLLCYSNCRVAGYFQLSVPCSEPVCSENQSLTVLILFLYLPICFFKLILRRVILSSSKKKELFCTLK